MWFRCTRAIALISVCTLATASVFCDAEAQAVERAPSIHYQVEFTPGRDRTDLVARASWTASPGETEVIGLPRDVAYGSPRLYRFVAELEGEEGTRIAPGRDSSEVLVSAAANGAVTVRYRLSFPPEAFGSATYAPSSGPEHLHLAGAQWLLRVGADSVVRRHRISAVAPRGWHVYSSLALDPRGIDVTSAAVELSRSVLGASTGGEARFEASGVTVVVHGSAAIAIPFTEMAEAVRRIVVAQSSAFRSARAPAQSTPPPFLHVVLVPRGGAVAGVASKGSLVCFIAPGISRTQLYGLLSHELMHTWITDEAIRVGPEESEAVNFLRSRWFIEGVNEFASRLVLRDAGLLTEREFADLVNRDLINLRENPHRAATLSDMSRAADSGRFDIAYTKLSYYRGALVALNWTAQLRRAGSGESLLGLLASVHAYAIARNAPLTEEQFFAHLGIRGIDPRADFERHVVRGEAIVADSEALGPQYRLVDSVADAFEPGFRLDESRAARVVRGVIVGGAAERAGLRDGMRILSVENGTRFANAWDPAKPLVVVVAGESGPRRVEIAPRGPPMYLPLFAQK